MSDLGKEIAEGIAEMSVMDTWRDKAIQLLREQGYIVIPPEDQEHWVVLPAVTPEYPNGGGDD